MAPSLGCVAGLFALFTLAGCSPALVALGSPCVPEGPLQPLPPLVHESSGVVESGTTPGVFWTHNDSGGRAELYVVDARGILLGTVAVSGATNVDWEELDRADCPGGGQCLYIADTGDNLERRSDPALYRVREPEVGAGATEPAERFPLRFPDGPRDVEAAFVLPGERLFFVTKGRNHAVELYRAAPLVRAGEPVLLERIQTLSRWSPALPRHVTGAGASADGSVVAVRSYETLQFYHPDPEGRLTPIPGGLVNLRSLAEGQGEAVALLSGNRVALTSEAGPFAAVGAIGFLRCEGVGVGW